MHANTYIGLKYNELQGSEFPMHRVFVGESDIAFYFKDT